MHVFLMKPSRARLTVWQQEHWTLVAPRMYIKSVWHPPQTNCAISVPALPNQLLQNSKISLTKRFYDLTDYYQAEEQPWRRYRRRNRRRLLRRDTSEGFCILNTLTGSAHLYFLQLSNCLFIFFGKNKINLMDYWIYVG